MADRTVMVVLGANVSGFVANMRTAQQAASNFSQTTMRNLTRSATDNRAAWDASGRALTAFGAIGVGALGGAIKAAIDWETAWTGVLKTVDGTPAQLAKVEDGLRGLARELPISHAEIAGVAEAAGQLGIATDDVVAFSKVMIDLGQTTNLSSEEAATALARISNIMGTSASDVGRMGATIVELGNNSATTEGEIVAMSTRLAAAGKQAGLSEANIFAFASTLTSVGVEAEAGGTAISKVFTSIADATKDGGDQLDTFAKVAGMSAADFKAAFEADAAGGVAAFIEGMGRMANAGESTTQVFKDLELNDARLKRAVLSTGAASGLLTEQLGMANSAWEENTALIEEAEKRYDTTASKIQGAKGSIVDAAITVGDAFLPVVAEAADGVGGLANAFGKLPDPVQQAVGGIAGIVGVTSLAAGGFLLMFPRMVETGRALQTIGALSPRASAGLATVARNGLKFAAAGAGIAIVGVSLAKIAEASYMKDIDTGMARVAKSILEASDNASTANLAAIFQDKNGGDLITGVNDFDSAISRTFNKSWDQSFNDWGSGIMNTITGIEGDTQVLEQTWGRMDTQLTDLVAGGHGEKAAEVFELIRQKAKDQGVTLREVKDQFPGYIAALEAGEVANMTAASEVKTFNGEVYQSAEEMEAAAEAAAKWAEEVNKASASFVSISGSYDAAIQASMDWAQAQADATDSADDSWEDFYNGTDVSVQGWIDQLNRQNEALANWQANVLAITNEAREQMPEDMATAVDGMIDELVKMGPDGAAALQTFRDASLEERTAIVNAWLGTGYEISGNFAAEIDSARTAEMKLDVNGDPAVQTASEVYRNLAGITVSPWALTSEGSLAEAEGEETVGLLSGMMPTAWDLMVDDVRAIVDAQATRNTIGGMGAYLTPWSITGDATPAEVEAENAKNVIDGKKGTIQVYAAEAPGLWNQVESFVDRISSRTATIKVAAGPTGAQAKATGGPVFGAGTSTSDSIPALLSNGEHVLTAREVQAMGGHSAVERMRAGALSGALPGFATGGAVTRLRDQAQALRREEKAELEHAEWLKRVFGDTSGADAATARARGVAERAQAVEKAMADEQARLSRLDSARQSMTRSTRRGDVVNQATSSLSGAYSVVDQLWDGARNPDFSQKQRGDLWAAAAKAEPAMKRLYGQAEKLDKSLANARDKAQELSQIKSSVSGVLGKEFSLGGQLGQKDQYGYDKAVTSKSLVAAARGKAAQIKAFAGKLDRLRKMGLSGLVLQEVAELGTEEGTLVADALIKGGKTDIAALNNAYKSIGSWSDKAGQYVTEGFYKGGYDAAAGLVKGLESQQAAIEKQMLTIAKGMEKALKKALGIKSPSRVMAALGVFAGQGLAEGLESQAGLVAQSADALAVAAQPDLKAGPTTLYTAPSGGRSSSPSQADLSSVISAVQAGLEGANIQVAASLGVGKQDSASIVRVGMQERSRNDQGQMKKEVGV